MAVAVEQKALDMVLDLLGIPVHRFQGRSVTTGATASNIMGLACARDALLLNSPHLPENYTIAENGFPPSIPSPTNPGESFIPPIKVLTVKAHGSILKAAAVTGIGRMNVHEAADASSPNLQDPWSLKFDLGKLARELETAKRIGQGVIVVVTLGEVNTGGFTPDIPVIADLCKAHGAWLHIDAAFGGFAALLPHYKYLSREMEMADSLTLDAHKWLNGPRLACRFAKSSRLRDREFKEVPGVAAVRRIARTGQKRVYWCVISGTFAHKRAERHS
ncbi:hypothetical protein QFC19_001226 [Naganishia cerealis]|uniref:Uncharacterized protein n=1 Tax=Naganishia cerealis TaxID=610337 RepID=A0ACC2WIJ0_9TREE|nr:hypothetical protein QFC19_001226 [Naganishia cerealis]